MSPKTLYPHKSVEWLDANEEKPVQVSCGKCIPCLSSKRNDWTYRLQQEWKASKNGAIFVTLTYDDKHCPGQLVKRDLQLFMKRLRKRDGSNTIRFYAVGEYGSKFGRPHYHVLLFNAEESHVRQAWTDKNGKAIGIVHVGKVTEASVAYVTKYIVQPQEASPGFQRPFSLMSRKYGIGGKYLTDEMVAWHRSNSANYAMHYDQKVRLPRFYKNKIWPSGTTTKIRKPADRYQKAILDKYQKSREKVSSLSLEHSLRLKIKEELYWKNTYGESWERQKAEAELRVIQRVHKKVSFTQKL